MEDIEDTGETNYFATGIGLLIAASIIYFIIRYVAYEYVGAWILEYMSYFIAFFGILFMVFGIIGKMLDRKITNDN